MAMGLLTGGARKSPPAFGDLHGGLVVVFSPKGRYWHGDYKSVAAVSRQPDALHHGDTDR
jgi:hypothetical protein